MAISLIDNLKIQNKKQNVERDSFATIADMVSYSPNYLPNIFHAMCEETGKMYVYNVNNDEDPDLGRWRVLEGSGGGTADVPIEKIKVNGELQTPVNKVVDITVPSIDGLTKDADLATVAKSGSYEDLANKPAIPSVEGLAKTTDIPTKVSQLENDSNYLSSIPEEYVTDTELNAKGYLTEHQDISGKVYKVEGKGLSTNDLTDELKQKYDDAVTAKHTHENGTVLDKFSESNEGVLLFNGEKIESELALDSTPIKDSKNYVNSGSVYSSLFETKQRTVIDTPENYVVCTSTDIGALEVVADDTTPTTTQVTLSVVQAFIPTAQVGEYYQHIDEVSHLEDYEDTIYREKDDSYSSIEVDEKIKEVNDRITEIASGGLKTLSLTEYRSFMDNLVISADGYVAP